MRKYMDEENERLRGLILSASGEEGYFSSTSEMKEQKLRDSNLTVACTLLVPFG